MKHILFLIVLLFSFRRASSFSGLKPLVFRSRDFQNTFELAAGTGGGENFDLISAYGNSKKPAIPDSVQDGVKSAIPDSKSVPLLDIDNAEVMSNLKLKAAESSKLSSEKAQDFVTKISKESSKSSKGISDWLSNQADSTVDTVKSVRVSDKLQSIGDWFSDKSVTLTNTKISFPEFGSSDAMDRLSTVNEKLALIKDNTVEWATSGVTLLKGNSLSSVFDFQDYAIWYVLFLFLISYQAGRSQTMFEMKLQSEASNLKKNNAEGSNTNVADIKNALAEELAAAEKAKAEIEAKTAEAKDAAQKATVEIEANAAEARAAAEKAKAEMKKAAEEKNAAEKAKAEMEAAAQKAKEELKKAEEDIAIARRAQEELKTAEEDIATAEKTKQKPGVKGESKTSPATSPKSIEDSDQIVDTKSSKTKTKTKKKVKKVVKKKVKSAKADAKGAGQDIVDDNPFKDLTPAALKRKTVKELSTYLLERGVKVTDKDGKTLKKSLLLDAVNNI